MHGRRRTVEGMPREWDAHTHGTLPLPHEQWARRTLARLDLDGSETVLDAGCGTGRAADALLDALPSGRVIAVDGSVSKLETLRMRLADRLDRVTVVLADLTKPLPISDPVDAVVSVAAFRRIGDHQALFSQLAAVLKAGGQLVFECAGFGDSAWVNAALDTLVDDIPDVWNLATAEETARRLAAAGFVDAEVALVPESARFDDPDALHRYLETVVLRAHLRRLRMDERDALVRAVAERLPEPVVDHVRLTVRARRAGD
jgi:trans-aconitate 2-methyltransferase